MKLIRYIITLLAMAAVLRAAAPSVSLSVPSTVYTNQSFTAYIYTSDSDGDLNSMGLRYQGFGLQGWWSISGSGASASVSLTAPSSPGTMNLRGEVFDNASNGTTGGWYTVQVINPPPPNSPPTCSITGSTSLVTGQTGSWNYSASDSNGNLYRWRVSLAPNVAQWSYISGSSASSSFNYTFNSPGTYTFNLNVEDTNGATASSSVTVTVYATQTITFPQPANRLYGEPPFALSASASSGLPVSYAVISGPASVSGGTVTVNGTGTITIRASQNGGASGGTNYAAASPVDRSFVVSANNAPTVSVTGPANLQVGQSGTYAISIADANSNLLRYRVDFDDFVQWFNVSGGSASTTRTVVFSTPGTYVLWARAEDTLGVQGSGSCTVVVSAVAPAITTQPASQTVTTGQTSTFSVAASGTAPLSYQWKKDGAAISGATNASYAIANPQPSAAGNYSVAVSNSAGSVTSNQALLNFKPVASISGPSTLLVGETGTYTIGFTDVNSNLLRYRVHFDDFVQWISALGASANTTRDCTFFTAGTYTLVVEAEDAMGATHTASTSVTVTAVAPTISTHPASQTVVPGQTTTFSVSAGGTPVLNYQWRKDGAAISGATNSSYAIADPQPSAAGLYSVTVTNNAGSATSNAALLNFRPTAVITGPATLAIGQPGTYNISFGDVNGNLTQYRVHFDDFVQWISASGSSASTTRTCTFSTAGTYTLVIEAQDALNANQTASLVVTVAGAPPVITSALTKSATQGQATTYAIVATNTPTSYSATPLPAGLVLNATTGVISGAPTAAGTVSTTLRATNASGFDEKTLVWSIAPLNPNADDDGDGVTNGVELLLGLNPNDPSDVLVHVYEYDAVNQLTRGPGGQYNKDAEGNIKEVRQ